MPGTNLTRAEAATRAELLHVDTYVVDLDLTTSESTFATTSTIRFTCTSSGAETFVDFVGGTVQEIVVNGTSLDPAEYYRRQNRFPDDSIDMELVRSSLKAANDRLAKLAEVFPVGA